MHCSDFREQFLVNNFDRAHIWHPYTSITDPLPVYPVASCDGVRIKLEDGRELVDGMSSWWCAIHGYNHPTLNTAAVQQLQRMSHVMYGGFSHQPATSLAQKLVQLTPAGLDYVFFSDCGSVSVEVALKMAVQYWHNQGHADKQRLLTIRGGYHGDTFGAMSVCDPDNGMHSLFADSLQQQFFAPRPSCRFGEAAHPQDLESVKTLLQQYSGQIAAIILEPVVQGAGGMWFYSADYLRGIAELCAEYDVLLICDEIATGFGRSGKMFASEHANISPDILCLGKALTGGYMSLAATLTNKRVRDGISADGGVLMHGPTFMANPLACAVANASIELLQAGPWQQRVAGIESQLRNELEIYRGHSAVNDVRVLGAIGVVETCAPVNVAEVQKKFVEAGVWIRPFGNLIYLMPPYVISGEDLSRLTAAVALALDEAMVPD
jgi:adenosylmethionine-8-amino-7-oxononanoate aminotransferase